MCASHGDFSKPQGAMKVKASFGNSPRQDPGAVTSAGRTAGPSDAAGGFSLRLPGGARAHTLVPERW